MEQNICMTLYFIFIIKYISRIFLTKLFYPSKTFTVNTIMQQRLE